MTEDRSSDPKSPLLHLDDPATVVETAEMRVSQERWATIGKILAGVATVLSVVGGAVQLAHSFGGPSVTAYVSVEENRIGPKIREELSKRISRESLLKVIEEQETKKEPASKVLDVLKERVRQKDAFDSTLFALQTAFDSKVLQITIRNDSGEVANDVRLLLPGSGVAEISETGHFDVNKPPIAWNKVLPIGPIRPKSAVEVLAWPEESIFLSLYGVHAAVVHTGGSGTVQYTHSFYGWDADLVAWFLVQAWFVRYGLVTIALLVAIVLGRILVARGYFVFPRSDSGSKDTEAPASNS